MKHNRYTRYVVEQQSMADHPPEGLPTAVPSAPSLPRTRSAQSINEQEASQARRRPNTAEFLAAMTMNHGVFGTLFSMCNAGLAHTSSARERRRSECPKTVVRASARGAYLLLRTSFMAISLDATLAMICQLPLSQMSKQLK